MTKASQILEGLRVVDCSTGTAGPRAAGLLADYGADVVWVEPPGGDRWRRELAVEYAVFNRNKRSVECDRHSEGGQRQLETLLAAADVLVTSERPGRLANATLDWNALHRRHPKLIHADISGFGSASRFSDLSGYEAIVHAVVGSMGEQVGFREGPIYEGLPFASTGTAYLAVIGTLAALYRRAADGVGRHVESSLLDGAAVYLAMMWGDTDAKPGKKDDYPTGGFLPGGATRMITGYFRCGDDEYIGVHTGAVGAFGRLMTVLGLDDRIPPSEDGMDVGKPLTAEERDVLESEIHGIFESQARDTWVDRLLDADVCGIAVMRPGEVFDLEQSKCNAAVVTVDDPTLGRVEQIAPPVLIADDRTWRKGRAPLPGEHTDTVIAEWSQSRPSVPWFGSQAFDDGPPLAGMKVLDCGAYYAGPASSRHLADLGADVIKLETLAGDMLRGLPRLFQTAQSGKRSISVNMKDPELDRARRALLGWADILHHNMRPGAADRIGLGPNDAAEVNPTLIYGYAPGWGSSGPYSMRQSFEPMLSGLAGAAFESAGQYNSPVYPLGNADPGNGLAGAVGMLLTLLHRQRTGEALRFENPQLNAAMSHVAHIVRDADGNLLNADRLDPLQMGRGALDRLYETADGWVCVTAPTEHHIRGIERALGCEILTNEAFATPEAREAHDYELSQVIDEAVRRFTTSDALRRLREVDVPAVEPVGHNNYAFMRDPENRASRLVGEAQHPVDGTVRDFDQFVRISDCVLPPFALAPELGEHTFDILATFGYAADEIDRLAERGAVRQAPPG